MLLSVTNKNLQNWPISNGNETVKHDEIDGQLHCELQKAPHITNSLKEEAAGPSTSVLKASEYLKMLLLFFQFHLL